MKRSLSTEVDADAILDGFLSERADVRQRAMEAVERRRREDPGALALTLARRIATPDGTAEARVLAAVLLRKVLLRITEPIEGFGDVMLKALTSTLSDDAVRRHTADAAATAASIQFSSGQAWPEFALLIASWCASGPSERAAVLRILEQLGDETGDDGQDVGDEEDAATETAAMPRGEQSGVTDSAATDSCRSASFYALLAFLEDNGGALHALLASSLQEDGDEVVRDAAARVYTICAAGAQAPMSIRTAVRDLSAVVADAATVSALAAAKAEPEQTSAGEAVMQAVALAARADPAAWAPAAGVSQAALPAALAAVVAKPAVSAEVRTAALAALLELTDAASTAVEAASVEAGSVFPFGVHNTADEVVKYAATATTAVLAQLPLDEGVDEWAVEVDGEVVPGSGDGVEGLLDAALDGAARLAQRGGCAATHLVAAALEFLRREAWQPRHGAILLQLRLACAGGEIEASTAAEVAIQHFTHVHPRVRWAALEVWARLLASGFEAPQQKFGEAFEALSAIAGCDTYMRVRRHGVFVLLVATTHPESPVAVWHVEPLFRRVLIPQAASLDDSIREACATIAQRIATLMSVAGLRGMSGCATSMEEEQPDASPSADDVAMCDDGSAQTLFAALWVEFSQAAAAAAPAAGVATESACMVGGNQDAEATASIQWPADWR